MKKLFFVIISLFAFCSMGFAATCEQSGTNWYPGSIAVPSLAVEDIQQCITSGATDGHTIHLPALSAEWALPLIITNKNINIIGAGIGKTVITATHADGNLFIINLTTKAQFRLSGMTLNGNATTKDLYLIWIKAPNAATYLKGFRIDNIRVLGSRTAVSKNINVFMFYGGVVWGLIDHCTFDVSGEAKGLAIMQFAPYKTGDGYPMGKYAHSLPLNLGSDEAVYFEDNVVNFRQGGFVFNMAYGGNVVVRHNTITGTYMQTHSARGNDRGGVKFEIYNNIINGAGYIWPAMLRSGTGVIFNNTVSGYINNNFVIDNQRTCSGFTGALNRCNGSNSNDGNTAGEYGWPCVDQIGWTGVMGSQTNVPLYAWNNGKTATCVTGEDCNNSSIIVLNSNFDLCRSAAPPSLSSHLKTTGDISPHTGDVVDYVNNGSKAKTGYEPYTYPHPLMSRQRIGNVKTPLQRR